jgi:hypothetical protein
MMSLAHVRLIYPIGHMHAEPELEVPTEQDQVEDLINLDLNQSNPRWLANALCLLFLNIYLCFTLIVH